MKHILLVDDDDELGDLLTEYLAGEGFSLEIVSDGQRGLDRARSGQHMLVILDIMLPSMNGLEVLKQLRKTSGIPVLMLTARGEEIDRILGLEMGADDYLPKPFNPRELVARLRAIERRVQEIQPATAAEEKKRDILTVDDVIIDLLQRIVTCGGEAVAVTGAEFSLLHQLLANAGNVVSRDELICNALGRKPSVFDRSIDVHISSLRKKLGRNANGYQRIRSVRGVGYIYTPGREAA